MPNATVTTNITFPRDDWRMLKIVCAIMGKSMAEFVRESIRKALQEEARKMRKAGKQVPWEEK